MQLQLPLLSNEDHPNLSFLSKKNILYSIEQHQEKWYDLALVRFLLQNEKNLNKITTIEEHTEFLKNELDRVNSLFSAKNDTITRQKLDEPDNERTKQMFPRQIKIMELNGINA